MVFCLHTTTLSVNFDKLSENEQYIYNLPQEDRRLVEPRPDLPAGMNLSPLPMQGMFNAFPAFSVPCQSNRNTRTSRILLGFVWS